jgi:hypothetical protein
MSQVDARFGIVTGDAPITPSSPDAPLISTGSEEAGLWLWHGEAPPPPSLPLPKLGVRRILARMKPSARWAAWTAALPGGLALTLLAVSAMYSAPPHRSEPADAPAVALAPTASPTTAPSIAAVPPAPPTEVQSDQTRASLAPAPQISGQGSEQPMVSSSAQRKSPRTVRKTHAQLVRRGPPVLIPGVLTPPVMAWHGGGY